MILKNRHIVIVISLIFLTASCGDGGGKTMLTIRGNKFYINGEPTYRGITWRGNSIEGLMLNSRRK